MKLKNIQVIIKKRLRYCIKLLLSAITTVVYAKENTEIISSEASKSKYRMIK